MSVGLNTYDWRGWRDGRGFAHCKPGAVQLLGRSTGLARPSVSYGLMTRNSKTKKRKKIEIGAKFHSAGAICVSVENVNDCG